VIETLDFNTPKLTIASGRLLHNYGMDLQDSHM